MDSKIYEIIDDAKLYTSHHVELLKLQLAEKTSIGAAEFASHLIIGVVGILFLLFASVSLGLLFGDLLNNLALGFFLVAAIYLVFFLVFLLAKKTLLKKPLINYTIKKIFEDED
ncbi:phage holin family protein [Acidiluteibacter ferrifornacis]|uniref:Phage holin family protein n=1 Tax=Acidiluteibacter ferrifornacis TaxID=2692424 RepID=A0A6N9NPN5_9FLAO|nr:phage holin family protein [Acidiluteibacter ferrifornacis]MBR9831540.1 hypothetical protein [bacterium]NBG67250.1 hypothetical protein [Acidiluteibacter ferrifornacis]